MRSDTSSGFTLIELSIVLVIIGLLVGGVLVGQDLIRAAEIRAQMTQIEKYNTAVNTFYGKYDAALPGDMPPGMAVQFGFTVGAGCTGQQGGRDGNRLLDGYAAPLIYAAPMGETSLFWQDLSAANLIDGPFPVPNQPVTVNCLGGWSPIYADYFPAAKIGYGNYIYVYESNGYNWYGVSAITAVPAADIRSSATLPVSAAYAIDKKLDDGFPGTGSVQAVYINNSQIATSAAPNAAPDSATTCFNTTTAVYSVAYNNGNAGACALSFRFQ